MKKKIITMLIIILIVVWIVSVVTVDRLVKTDYCKDKEIVLLLKNDRETPEFVLNGAYYSLPCNLSDFLKNGWYVIDIGYSTDSELLSSSWEDYVLPADSYTVINLKNYYVETAGITVCVGNPSEIERKICECQVLRIEYAGMLDKTKSNRNFFVTAFAVNLTTSWSKIIDDHIGYKCRDSDQGYGQYAYIESQGINIIEVLPRKGFNDIGSNTFRIQSPLMINLKYNSFQ